MFLSISDLLLNPDYGLFIWTTVIFLVFWFFVIRAAKKPMSDMLGQRNTDIQEALDEAEKARIDMANLKVDNAKMIADAREEQAQIIADAKATKDQIVEEAKVKATEEAERIMANAKMEIESQKKVAISEVKNQSSLIALAIAERVIRKQLKGNEDQEALANELIKNIKLS
jgi:F-type H+-transporting ATPase subunit b